MQPLASDRHCQELQALGQEKSPLGSPEGARPTYPSTVDFQSPGHRRQVGLSRAIQLMCEALQAPLLTVGTELEVLLVEQGAFLH